MRAAFLARRLFAATLSIHAFLIVPAAASPQTAAEPPRTIVGPPPPALPAMAARDDQRRLTMRAVRLDRPLTLDGHLDEAIYQRVPAVNGFIQQEPIEGEAATEDTDVWVFYDETALYIVGRMWDSQPDRIVANELRRDSRNIGQNDSFSVGLDTFYDRRSGYYFQTNAIGAIREALVADERSNNFDWNTVWETRSARFDRGWVAEMAIPFKSLRYRQDGEQIWGINIRRVVRWKNETSFLSPVPASYGGPAATRFNVAATLVGIEVPPPAQNFEVKPFAISKVLTNTLASPPASNEVSGDYGFDAKYSVTRSLTFDFTYRTDFAQVEEDEQQVNLTRFSQFFPERREFFLEGQGLFEFASVRTRGGGGGGGGGGGPEGGQQAPNETPLLFFSRRIGLNGAVETPIVAGARLTGRVGSYAIGLLNIESGEEPTTNAVDTNFTVIRVKRDILRRSSIGVIATNRTPNAAGAGSNQAAGIDASLAFFDNVNIGGYWAATASDGRDGDNQSYRGQFDYNADRYGVSYEFLKVGEDFNPEIGYLRRQNFQRHYAQLRFSPRPRGLPNVRKLYYEANLDYIANDTDAILQSRIGQATFRADLQNGDVVEANYNRRYEALPEPLVLVTGEVTLPTGAYAFNDVDALYRLGPQRRLSGDVRVAVGGFYDGTRTEVSYTGRFEMTPRLSIEPRLSVTAATLTEGSFVTKLLTNRTTFALTPRVFATGLVQYNSSTNSFSANVRLRWEYRPGSDFFVVYTEGRDTSPTAPDSLQSRGFVVKFTRLFRL